jgi:hypothetical protein
MHERARWFSWAVWAGIATNLGFAVPALLAPDRLTAFFGLPPATPAIWLQFSGWLLLLLSAFYVPAARAPHRERTTAWLAVGARWAGAAFFFTHVLLLHAPAGLIYLGAADLFFGVVEGVLLARLDPAARPAADAIRS